MSHAAAKSMVIGILGTNGIVGNISFQIRGVPYSPTCFQQVKAAMQADTIRVRHWPQGGSSYASYYSGGSEETRDTLYTGFTSIQRPTQQGLIVHECMHAWCDLRNFHWMTTSTSEAAGWLSQCVALRNLGLSTCPTGSTTESQACWDVAWRLAEVVRAGQRQLTDVEVEELRTALAANPEYTPGAAPAEYDGIS